MLTFYSRSVQAAVEHRDKDEPLSMNVAGPSIIFLVVDIFIYWAFMICYEMKIWRYFIRRNLGEDAAIEVDRTSLHDNAVDEDIMEEEKRVELADPNGVTVKVLKVKKQYGGITAVKRVSFGLEYGECFALLGVSGAGKTTTFKCLTGEVTPTQGEVMINNLDVTTTQGF